MERIVKVSDRLSLRYIDYKERPMTNEERYEANIRSDFRVRKIPDFTAVEIILDGQKV